MIVPYNPALSVATGSNTAVEYHYYLCTVVFFDRHEYTLALVVMPKQPFAIFRIISRKETCLVTVCFQYALLQLKNIMPSNRQRYVAFDFVFAYDSLECD